VRSAPRPSEAYVGRAAASERQGVFAAAAGGGRRSIALRPTEAATLRRPVALACAVHRIVFDEAELHKAGGDRAHRAAVGRGKFGNRLVRGEAVAKLLFFLWRPVRPDLRAIRVKRPIRPRPAPPLQRLKCHEQGADRIGLLIGTTRRERLAGRRVAPVRERANDLCRLLGFHRAALCQDGLPYSSKDQSGAPV